MYLLNIGTLLREIRNKQNLTLKEVSTATGIADETIRRIETDKFEPKLSTLEILSDYYKVDLIELIARKRLHDSIFSEELILQVNDFINHQDFNGLKKFADSKINKITDDKQEQNKNLRLFLYTLKYIKYNPENGQEDTISLLEELILKIAPHDPKQLIYPYPFETSAILLLSVLYRQNGDYAKSVKLLESIIERILKLPYINERFTNYLASAYINLAYTFHSNSKHHKVIDTVNDCLNNEKINFTRTALSHLLFRKGLSMMILKIKNADAIIITSLSLMDDKTRGLIEEQLLKKYNFKIDL